MGNKVTHNYCTRCRKDYRVSQFYRSYNENIHPNGYINLCKKCSREIVPDFNDIEALKSFLRMVDKPFFSHLYNSAKAKSAQMGEYFKLINAKDFRLLAWSDGDTTESTTHKIENQSKIFDEDVDSEASPRSTPSHNYLVERWGYGYSPEEYGQFERKYQALKNHYPERTSMHTEALLTYIRYRVKEEMATASGDAKAAKDWGTLAKDAATAAKINPQQLSKSDLSDGLDSFSQLVRSVEQAVDIIEILPRFKERPKDRVDFTIWCYINYIRDLKGLPPAEYSEIYQFYEERKKEYEKMDEVDADG